MPISPTSSSTAAGPTTTDLVPPWPAARLTGRRPALDPRVAIVHAGCVDIALASHVSAASYVAPSRLRCRTPRTAMRRSGDADAPAVSELLFGEPFDLFDSSGDWAFGRNPADGYAGWVQCDAIEADLAVSPVQRITARIAPIFALPDIKAPVQFELPFGAFVAGVPDQRFLALDGGGFVHRAHLAAPPPTPLACARLFTGAPYLWGGRTPLGVDCSGLVQAALAACGIAAPRDSDQQRDQLGIGIEFEARATGDLVFFQGHVGLLTAFDTLLHANAHWMATVEEPLADVIARGAEPIAVRRICGESSVWSPGPPHAGEAPVHSATNW